MKRVLLILLAMLGWALPVWSARLFTSGCESNEGTGGIAEWTLISASNASFDNTHVHSGSYACKTVSTGGNQFFRRDLAASVTSGTYFVRSYVYFETLPQNMGGGGSFFSWLSSAGNLGGQTRVLPDGTILLINTTDSSQISSAAGAIGTGAWYRVEVQIVVSTSGAGSLELKVDGTSIGTLSSKTTISTNLQRFQFGLSGTGSTGTVWQDGIAINDATGTFQASYPGEGKIALIRPDGDVAVTWTKAGSSPAASNWQGVDEVPGTPNDGSDYNSDANTSNVDRLSATDLPAEVPSDAVITLLDVSARVGSDGTTARSMILRLWDDAGNPIDGPSVNVAVNGWKITTTSEHLVINGANQCSGVSACTKSKVSAMNLGYKGNSGSSRNKFVTAIWANVEWKPPATSSTRKRVWVNQ